MNTKKIRLTCRDFSYLFVYDQCDYEWHSMRSQNTLYNPDVIGRYIVDVCPRIKSNTPLSESFLNRVYEKKTGKIVPTKKIKIKSHLKSNTWKRFNSTLHKERKNEFYNDTTNRNNLN